MSLLVFYITKPTAKQIRKQLKVCKMVDGWGKKYNTHTGKMEG